MNLPPLTRVGPLEVLDMKPPRAASGAVPTVVLFHGYGADAYDLASLVDEITLPRPVRWIFPQGPLKVPIGPGFTGRAWFPIDVAAHERAMVTEEGVDYSESRTPQMDQAREKALQMLAALQVDLATTVLGGFSQGSMLAVDMTVNLPVTPAGLVILSGTLVDEANLKEAALRHREFQFFQSHGNRDDVLPFSGADRLNRVLSGAGWSGHLLEFKGGHEIPPKVLTELESYLQSVLV